MHAVVRPALRMGPSSSPARLRAARSTPELRRTFVSATLLSRTDFERKTVVQLKEELKSRGLSTSGKNKQALLTRLLEDEHKRINASVPPPLPKSPSGGVLGMTTAERSISTSATAAAKEATPALGSRGPNLMPSLLNEGYKATVWPASISFPQMPEELEEGVLVPFIPDKYDSHLQSHALNLDPVVTPQVSTTVMPSTLPGGGPAHASSHAYDGETLSAQASAERKAAAAAATGIIGDFVNSLGIDRSGRKPNRTIKQVRATMTEAYNELEQRTGVHVPTMKELLSKADKPSSAEGQLGSAGGEKFNFEDRPLNQQEKTGVWALGALLAGGWLLGGVNGSRRNKDGESKGPAAAVAETGGYGSASPAEGH